MRSNVVFMFLNYVSDKVVRVVLTTLALMLTCVYIIKRNFVAKTWTRSVDFILLFTVFICLASVIVGFRYFSVVRPLNNRNHLAKWYVMRSRELPGTMFGVRFPEYNCTPQNIHQPIRFKHSSFIMITILGSTSMHDNVVYYKCALQFCLLLL